MNRTLSRLMMLVLILALVLGFTACDRFRFPFRQEDSAKSGEESREEAERADGEADWEEAGTADEEAERSADGTGWLSWLKPEDDSEPETYDGAAEDGMPVLADTPSTGDPDIFHTVRVTDVEDGKVIRVQEYNYDDQWRRTETIEDGVVVEKYTYDQDGNVLTHWTTPPSLFVEYEYDGSGNRVAQTSYPFYEPNGEWTRHTYTLDSQGRKISDQLTSYEGTDRLYYSWEYDADGSYTRYFYNNDGELIEISRFNDRDDMTMSKLPDSDEWTQEFVYEYSEEGFWFKKSYYMNGVLSQVEEYEIDEFGKQGAHYMTFYDANGDVTQHYLFSDSQRDENGNILVLVTYYSNYTDSPDRYSYYEKVNSRGEHIGGYPG